MHLSKFGNKIYKDISLKRYNKCLDAFLFTRNMSCSAIYNTYKHQIMLFRHVNLLIIRHFRTLSRHWAIINAL